MGSGGGSSPNNPAASPGAQQGVSAFLAGLFHLIQHGSPVGVELAGWDLYHGKTLPSVFSWLSLPLLALPLPFLGLSLPSAAFPWLSLPFLGLALPFPGFRCLSLAVHCPFTAFHCPFTAFL